MPVAEGEPQGLLEYHTMLVSTKGVSNLCNCHQVHTSEEVGNGVISDHKMWV